MAPLNAKIEQVRGSLAGLRSEIRAVEAELETFTPDCMRFDALREACNLLDRLEQLEAGQLFWGESPEVRDPAGHMARLRSRITCFDHQINGFLEKQANLKTQENRRLDELDYLYDQVDEAYDRDERRENEYAIIRELSPVSHESVMPWSAKADQHFRRNQFTAMFISLLVGIAIQLVVVPKVVRPVVAKIPERLAMMVREEPRKPEPVKKHKEEKPVKKQEEKAGENKVAKTEEKKQAAPAQAAPAPARPKAEAVEQTATPRKTQTTGVLAFKEAFRDLLDETTTPRLGAEARVSNARSGQDVAGRSLVAMQGKGGAGNAPFSHNVGSGGIGDAAIGRSIGSGDGRSARLGRGGDFVQVKSAIAQTASGAEAKDAKHSAGGRAGRTDEEIQILFDRYKSALYRIYNTELRKDPTLRGKMVLRVTIEPDGVVSACAVESSNMDAPQFASQIVERVRKFNFGPKEGVPRMTILYPIDFLPAR